MQKEESEVEISVCNLCQFIFVSNDGIDKKGECPRCGSKLTTPVVNVTEEDAVEIMGRK